MNGQQHHKNKRQKTLNIICIFYPALNVMLLQTKITVHRSEKNHKYENRQIGKLTIRQTI